MKTKRAVYRDGKGHFISFETYKKRLKRGWKASKNFIKITPKFPPRKKTFETSEYTTFETSEYTSFETYLDNFFHSWDLEKEANSL